MVKSIFLQLALQPGVFMSGCPMFKYNFYDLSLCNFREWTNLRIGDSGICLPFVDIVGII
jgi:hypothetical protein